MDLQLLLDTGDLGTGSSCGAGGRGGYGGPGQPSANGVAGTTNRAVVEVDPLIMIDLLELVIRYSNNKV